MQCIFRPMSAQGAQAIARWQYDGVYSFYNAESDPDDLAELLDPHNWPDHYYEAVGEQGNLIGFIYLRRDGSVVEIGLGLRPDLTGRGLGRRFLLDALDFAVQRDAPAGFRLLVATFNERAIRVYTKAGFQPAGIVKQRTNGGEYEFLRMVRPASVENERAVS
jgi:ribosomal-protein-alanine N-acetyltransferase